MAWIIWHGKAEKKRPAGHRNSPPARVIEIFQGVSFPELSHFVLQYL